jgi:hypothetical protein
MGALILEISDKHDFICGLRVKNKKLESRIEELEQKVRFREKIIRELRRSTRCQPQVEKSLRVSRHVRIFLFINHPTNRS